MLFRQYKCPQCGKPWGRGNLNNKHECGYELRILGCPECMNIIDSKRLLIQKRQKYLNKQHKVEYGCECPCDYVQLDMTVAEYSHRYYKNIGLHNNLPGQYQRFLREYGLFPLEKDLYDNYFDHNELNMKHWNIIRFFAFLHPESYDSKQYFLEEYGETYEELYRKTHSEEELKELEQIEKITEQRVDEWKSSLHPTPKCPICGSTRLTKISTLTKAAKISAFGIYGAGDIGKTYKCNNCGAKF